MKKHEHSTTRIPEIARACTMIWTCDGKIMVIGDPDEVTSIHEKYEDAEKAFLVCVEAIKSGKRYSGNSEETADQISHALEIVRKAFEARMFADAESVKKFMTSTILTVQLTRLGKNAYVLHNMETFKFLSDLSEVGILVPELFLAAPTIPGLKDQPYRDPEILKLLDEMKKQGIPSR